LRQGRSRKKPYSVFVLQRIFYSMFSTLTARQLQVIMPPWLDNYKAQQKKDKKPIDIEKIPDTNIEGVWFGDKNAATTIMIFFHGGGFAMPGMDMHAQLLARMADWGKGNLAIFAPAYTLTPYAVYPQALGECVEATRFILEGVGKSKGILLAGDSAGGQLVIALLSHVSGHQHPQGQVVKPLELQGRRFKGAAALSPWVSSDTKKFPSIHELSKTDMIGPNCATYWDDIYRAGKSADHYIVPEAAPTEWWAGLGESVDDLLILAGGDEAILEPIESWSKKVQEGWPNGKVRLVVGAGESHDEPLTPIGAEKLNAQVPGKETAMEGALYHWVKDLTA